MATIVLNLGFIDPHTHSVFSGDRSHEMAWKLAGATYEQVHKKGGGINHTVQHTRDCSEDELLRLLLGRLDRMFKCGTTHVEIKSGYGLDVETEMKMLRVIANARRIHPIGISSTFLAHSVPHGMSSEDATENVIKKQLPALARLQAAGDIDVDFVDVFLEKGFFNQKQARRILEAGAKMGLTPAFHGDELNDMASGHLAAAVGARSVSHLEELNAEGITEMAQSRVFGILLPTTAYILRLSPPPARSMIDNQVPVALASDFNPNAHCLDMPTTMNLACVTLRLTMEEALVASTINAAAALGVGNSQGTLEVGKQGDCIVLDAPSWEHIIYQMNPPIQEVFKLGIPASEALAVTRRTSYWSDRCHRSKAIQAKLRGTLSTLANGIPLEKINEPYPVIDESVPHAPARAHGLTKAEKRTAVENALRYFPHEYHAALAKEFVMELDTLGHIYMHRFRPIEYEMRAYPVSMYPAKSTQAAAIQHMIQNNLDPAVAQYPHELITYGGNGSVFSNWAQYHNCMKLLSSMNDDQTLVLSSGHPMGLFQSSPEAPRVVVTNGMVVPNYSSRSEYERMYAQGVSQYGNMTAGSYCYIGPQGIVHGTTLTLLNAGRKYLGSGDLSGKIFVTAGLGGMSGAQAKAAVIAGCVAVIAEIKESALSKRYEQGWVEERAENLDDCIRRMISAKEQKRGTSIAYHGNVVDLWERLAKEGISVDLGSDQTSCHDPFGGGYYPVQLSVDEANHMMFSDPDNYKTIVKESLLRHINAIDQLSANGMSFWDYGNSFLLEASRAGADLRNERGNGFRYPSYVQDIMGDIFSLGFGPFRWVCTSADPNDLLKTDRIAADVMCNLREACDKNDEYGSRALQHFHDNHRWIVEAPEHHLVVGSQARILYANGDARRLLARRFNDAIADGSISGPIALSRDHHDVSGVDSPWRETSNIDDGSMFTADMAIQNVIGDSFRGATWVAIHNGGGTGWGEAINGGFGLVLDGSRAAAKRADCMLHWDVFNGVTRRAWAGNNNAQTCVEKESSVKAKMVPTLANWCDPQILDDLGL